MSKIKSNLYRIISTLCASSFMFLMTVAVAVAEDGCEHISTYDATFSTDENAGGIFHYLFVALFSTAQTMANQSAAIFARPFANLLLIGLALFIAYEVLKLVSSWTQQDIRKNLDTIAVQTFKMMLAYFILVLPDGSGNAMGQFYHFIVNPLLNAGFDFGTSLLIDGNIIVPAMKAPVQGFLSDGIYSRLVSFPGQCQNNMAHVYAIGRFLHCFAWEYEESKVLPVDIPIAVQALILMAMAILILLSFSFLLIDAVVQLGLFAALAPFIIAAWPFKITSRYTSSGWSMFVGTFLTFAMAGVTLCVVMALVAAAISQGNANIDELWNILGGNSGTFPNVEQVRSILHNDSGTIIVTLACAIIAFRLTGKVDELVKTFGGDTGPGIGSDMGKQAMTAAKRAGGTVLKGAKNVGKGAFDTIDEATGNKISNFGKKIATKTKKGTSWLVASPALGAIAAGRGITRMLNRRGRRSGGGGGSGDGGDDTTS